MLNSCYSVYKPPGVTVLTVFHVSKPHISKVLKLILVLFSHSYLFVIDDDLLANPADRNLQQTLTAGQAGLK